TPDRVLASTRPDPRTRFPHSDGINLYILEYDNGCRATSWDDVWTGPAREGSEGDIYIRWRVEGTDGLARGTIGWPGYPARTPSTLDVTTRQRPGVWLQPRWPEVWFPDACVGTMAQLLCSLDDGTAPEISGVAVGIGCHQGQRLGREGVVEWVEGTQRLGGDGGRNRCRVGGAGLDGGVVRPRGQGAQLALRQHGRISRFHFLEGHGYSLD